MQNPHAVQVNPVIAAEVTRRLKLLLQAGHTPPRVFLCGKPNGVITWQQPGADGKPIVLLFTSFFAARDYIRATGVAAEVRRIDVGGLAESATSWIQSGADLYGLNRCPRCGVMNVLPLQTLKVQDHFFKFWAATRATQCVLGELKFRECLQLQNSSRPQARAALDTIRDHIDCSSPYLHELIAFFARWDGDEKAKQVSLDRLAEFGPQFADWNARWSGASLPSSLSTAIAGLAAAFGIEPNRTPP